MKPIVFNLEEAVDAAAATRRYYADLKPWHNATRRKLPMAIGAC